MWRILVYIAILCLLALGAVWLSGLSGEVTILLPDYVANVDLPVAAALLLALGFLIAIGWWLVAALLRAPFRIGRASKSRRRAKGYDALSRGMIAVGSGDSGKALRYAKEAQRLLGEEPLTLLLNAQVAQVTGNLGSADAAFKKMIGNRETKLLGLRGLFIEARRQGDHSTAYSHAREAVQIAPSASWANEAVLEAQCAEGAWSDALDMVDKRAAFGLIDKATAKRQRAVLLTADALAHEHTEPEKAQTDVLRALKFAPTLIPAAVLAGRLLARHNDVRKASKILERAWSANPHPDIADGYIHLRAGDSAQDRLKRAETLGRLSNWQPEARIAIAQAALDAKEFTRARDVLEPLITEHPTIRVCLLMADIEQAEHGSVGHAREWVARAARAPRDPAWYADGIVSDHWAPFSPVSGHIDAFIWQTPPDVLALSPAVDIDAGNLVHPDIPAPAIEPLVISPPPAAEAVIENEEAETVEAPEEEQTVPNEEESEFSGEETRQPERPLRGEPLTREGMKAAQDETTSVQDKPAPEKTAAAPGAPQQKETEEDLDWEDAETATEALIPPAVPKPDTSEPIAAKPKPVIFPIAHAPDDPGVTDEDKDKSKKR